MIPPVESVRRCPSPLVATGQPERLVSEIIKSRGASLLRVTIMNRTEITDGYRRNRAELEDALHQARDFELRRRSTGTRWSNEELLFHMVFGYLVTRKLLPLVKLFGQLPPSYSRTFTRVLDSGTRPFHSVNYWGSRAASLVYNRHRMAGKLDRITSALGASLERESERSLALQMAFPTRWDPFFAPIMTVADLYAYPIRHFDFHASQLSLPGTRTASA